MIHIDQGGDGSPPGISSTSSIPTESTTTSSAILLSVVARQLERSARKSGFHGERVPEGHHRGGDRLQLEAGRVPRRTGAISRNAGRTKAVSRGTEPRGEETPNGRGKGVFWWEPAVTGPLGSRGFFDDNGNALPGDDCLRQVHAQVIGRPLCEDGMPKVCSRTPR